MRTADWGNGQYKNLIVYADYSGLPILHSKDLVNGKVIVKVLQHLSI